MELSDLQNFIGQQGSKAKKESSRQISRLQTERRLLRSQAELLTVREWLPDELMQQILDLAIEEEEATAANGSPTSLRKFSEDDLLSRIWQLNLTLTGLDVSEEQTSQALQYILANPPADEPTPSIWGLSEILDWLALHSEPGQMLDYDAQKPKPQSSGAATPVPGKSFGFPIATAFRSSFIGQLPDHLRRTFFRRGELP
jgi:ATP-dependent RNA helicase DHX29